MMIPDREALEAYNLIKVYCGERGCYACIFQGVEGGCNCILDVTDENSPEEWQELEIE